MISITNHTFITQGENSMSMPKGKNAWTVKIGEKGQFVIPKEARDMFDIKPGDTVVVLCDKKKGMAIVKSEVLEDTMDKIMPDNK